MTDPKKLNEILLTWDILFIRDLVHSNWQWSLLDKLFYSFKGNSLIHHHHLILLPPGDERGFIWHPYHQILRLGKAFWQQDKWSSLTWARESTRYQVSWCYVCVFLGYNTCIDIHIDFHNICCSWTSTNSCKGKRIKVLKIIRI